MFKKVVQINVSINSQLDLMFFKCIIGSIRKKLVVWRSCASYHITTDFDTDTDINIFLNINLI